MSATASLICGRILPQSPTATDGRPTYLCPQHAQDLAALVAHDAPGLLVVEYRHGEAALVILLTLKIQFPQMGEGLMALGGIRYDVLPGDLSGARLLRGDEAPALLTEVPVHDGEGNDVFEPLELTRDERPAGPWTRIADVQVVPAFLGRELGASVAGDPAPERADLALELARGITGFDPAGDAVLIGRHVPGLRDLDTMCR